MLNDRGNIKWNAMMLPEHVKELRNYFSNDNKINKPVLDEQKLEEFNQTIN